MPLKKLERVISAALQDGTVTDAELDKVEYVIGKGVDDLERLRLQKFVRDWRDADPLLAKSIGTTYNRLFDLAYPELVTKLMAPLEAAPVLWSADKFFYGEGSSGVFEKFGSDLTTEIHKYAFNEMLASKASSVSTPTTPRKSMDELRRLSKDELYTELLSALLSDREFFADVAVFAAVNDDVKLATQVLAVKNGLIDGCWGGPSSSVVVDGILERRATSGMLPQGLVPEGVWRKLEDLAK